MDGAASNNVHGSDGVAGHHHDMLPTNGEASGSSRAAADVGVSAGMIFRKHKYRPYQSHEIRQASYSASQPSWPLTRDAGPQRPQTAIAPGQALHTTFPSRMRLGVSTLMQPIPQSVDQSDPVYGRSVGIPSELLNASAASGSRRSGRATANQRRYFEEESDDDEDEEDDDDDNNDDGASGIPNGHSTPGGIGSPRRHPTIPNSLLPPEEPPERPGQRLGQPPPGNKLSVKRARKTPHVYYSESDAARAADHREMLVPIRIDLETETHRIRDAFTWNINERLLTPAQYARVFLQDLDLPLEPYASQIEAAINQQIDEWAALAELDIQPARGGIWACRDVDASRGEKFRADIEDDRERAKDARGWDWGIRREFKRALKKRKRGGDEDSSAASLEGASGEWEDDLRVVVDYEAQILQHTLRDRLEWDLSSPLTPEALAAQTCKDIGLSGEALPAISAAIRESLLNHRRGALEQGIIGLGEMWGKAQQDEDDARRELAQRRKAGGGGAGGASAAPTPTPTVVIPSAASGATPTAAATPAAGSDGSFAPLMATRSHTAAVQAAMEATTASRPRSPTPPMSPTHKLELAIATKTELNNRGPRVLLAPWRDWFEAKEFGPLLERLSVEEIERREVEAMRASRRNRRAVGQGLSGIDPRERRFRAR